MHIHLFPSRATAATAAAAAAPAVAQGRITLDVANFVGLLSAMLLYGLFLGMFSATIGPLWARRRRGMVVVGFTIWLLVLVTANVVTFVYVNFEGFIAHRLDPGTIAYFNTGIASLHTRLIYPLMTLMGITSELLMIWRLRVIWDGSRRIIIGPLIFLAIEISSSIVLEVFSFPDADPIPSPSRHMFFVVFLIIPSAASAIVTLSCTSLICWRMWWLSRHVSEEVSDSRQLCRKVIAAMIESGALYTGSLLVYIVFAVAPLGPGVTVLWNYVFVMTIGITPLLIIMHLNPSSCSQSTNAVVDTEASVGFQFDHPNSNSPSSTGAFEKSTIGFGPTVSTVLSGVDIPVYEHDEKWKEESDNGQESAEGSWKD